MPYHQKCGVRDLFQKKTFGGMFFNLFFLQGRKLKLVQFFFFEQAKMEYVLKPNEKFQAQGVPEKTQQYTVTETIVKQN